eukprot:TRINITY_DN8925_c3_g1_i1.p1 TRINITY_DN8925_c3_g1~~TRINITY_DN8925_c3_g1_i1.p1  ORF type:complete len:354 (+),score=97.44 TRINITY_DN8925_c3_g1_i1:83-1144(+)
MGAAGAKTSRIALETQVQVHFGNGRVKREVADILRGWLDDGAPLGLMLEPFARLLCLKAEDEKEFFETFDTDQNSKVDALEVLSAAVLLGQGTFDEKVETLFPIFDFSGSGRLNFDEANIMLHSALRGLCKVCGPQAPDMEDQAVVEACRTMFDAHNLPYDKQVTRDQVRRWLRSDIEAAAFLESFQKRVLIAELLAQQASREQQQNAAFAELAAGDDASVSVAELRRSFSLRRALGEPGDDAFAAVMDAMETSAGGDSVSPDGFATVLRAWNAYRLANSGETAEAQDLAIVLRLFRQKLPSFAEVERLRGDLGLDDARTVSLRAWLRVALGSSAAAVAPGTEDSAPAVVSSA